MAPIRTTTKKTGKGKGTVIAATATATTTTTTTTNTAMAPTRTIRKKTGNGRGTDTTATAAATTTTITNTNTNTGMAPPRITRNRTPEARIPTPPTNSDTSSESESSESDSDSPAVTKKEKRNKSERKRLRHIKHEYRRIKKMIPSIKHEKKIETKPLQLLTAFDREAQKEFDRRAVLQQQIAAVQQAINERTLVQPGYNV